MASISKYLVTKRNMLQWCAADESPVYSGSTLIGANDLGDGNRDLTVSSSNPTVTASVAAINDMPAFTFGGSNNPLRYTGPLSVKHYFVLVSITPATFADYSGVLSGRLAASEDGMLVGNSGTNKFFDFGATGRTFYSRGYEYASTDMVAPVSGAWALVEVQRTTSLDLSGLQVGQDRDFSTRKLNGQVAEWIIYSDILTDQERRRIYQYFAKKYRHWEKNTSGLYVFPFVQDWRSPVTSKKIVLTDEAEDGSTQIYRTKRPMRRYYEPEFSRRTPDECLAAEAFYDEHYPGTHFIFRDKAFTPTLESEVVFSPTAENPFSPNHPTDFQYKLAFQQV